MCSTRMEGHSAFKIILIVVNFVLYVVELAFNALNAEVGRKLGLYLNSTSEISRRFNLEITPAGFTFSIWGFIFTWQLIWMLYAFSTICRAIKDGRYIYQLPILTPNFFGVFIVNSLLVTSWLFVWDRQEVLAAFVLLALTALTAKVSLGISFYNLYQNLELLIKQQSTKEIWFVRFFVQNGIAFYTAWVTVASLLNFAMVLHYEAGIDMTTSCTVSLSILAAELVLWFILDNTLLDKYTRYTFSQYITIVWALTGSFYRNYDLNKMYVNSLFLLVLLVASAVMLVLKIVALIWRHCRSPVQPPSYEPTV